LTGLETLAFTTLALVELLDAEEGGDEEQQVQLNKGWGTAQHTSMLVRVLSGSDMWNS